jgi:transketolase
MDVDLEYLQTKSNDIRRRVVKMVTRAGIGHLAGDLSVTDILVTLYFAVLKLDPRDPLWPDRDRLILSKGHCSGALYSCLAMAGFFPLEELSTYMQPLSRLNGHPNKGKVPGVEASTGPLGHGLPVGVGTAIAAKLAKASWRTYVVTGDGELQEGSNWEAAMAAAHYKLDNLTVIVDRNGLQQGDRTEITMGLEPLVERWEAFGWKVLEVNGHSHKDLLEVFESLPLERDRPNCIIAHTHKGQGVSFIRDQVGWHHRVPNPEETVKALLELGEVEE